MELTNPAKVRERILYYASLDEPKSFDSGVSGAITGVFNSTLMGDDKSMYGAALRRRQVWGFLFTKDEHVPMEFHSKGLSPMEWNALFRWMGGGWKDGSMRPQFKAECRWVNQWAEKAFRIVKERPSIVMAEVISLCSDIEKGE